MAHKRIFDLLTRFASVTWLTATVLAGGISASAAAPTPGPASLQVSTAVLPFSGGVVQLSGSVSKADTCTLTVKPALTGWVSSVPCMTFNVSVSLPGQAKATPASYTFTLAGKSKAGKVTPASVVTSVAAYPAPTIDELSLAEDHAVSGHVVTVAFATRFASTCSITFLPKFSGGAAKPACDAGSVAFHLPPQQVAPTSYKVTLSSSGQGGKTVKDLRFIASASFGDATAIASNNGLGCAVVSLGQVACWGANDFGQLGQGTVQAGQLDKASAVIAYLVQGENRKPLKGATAVSTNYQQACALVSGGRVYCWGATDPDRPQQATRARQVGFAPGDKVVKISLGDGVFCALLDSGLVKCWGWDPLLGAGMADTKTSATPLAVAGITDAVDVSAGAMHVCAVLRSGHVLCWGDNTYGQLGQDCSPGTRSPQNGQCEPAQDYFRTPVEVAGITTATSITAGYGHSCAVLRSGHILCWGRGLELGAALGSNVYEQPVEVPDVNDGVSVVSGNTSATFAIRQDGSVLAWGDVDRDGSIRGIGPTPRPVLALGKDALYVRAISAGGQGDATSACAVSTGGGVTCSGHILDSWRYGTFGGYIPGIGAH